MCIVEILDSSWGGAVNGILGDSVDGGDGGRGVSKRGSQKRLRRGIEGWVF